MNLNQLNSFILVCRCGSFSKAAAKSYISPQGMNSTILRLEHELGVKLFDRTPNGVTLTSDGEYLRKVAMEITDLVDECQTYFNKKNNLKHTLSLSYTPELTCAMPASFLTMILNKYHLDMHTCGSIACDERVANGESDCAFTHGPYFKSNLVYDYCFTKNLCLVAHRSNPLAQKNNLCIADLQNSGFIMPDTTFKLYHAFKEKCEAAGFSPNITFYTSTFSTVNTLLKKYPAWIGYSFDFYVEQTPDEEITPLSVQDFAWPWKVYLVHQKEIKNRYLNRFIDDVVYYFNSLSVGKNV